jgi:hypothetical protein
MAECSVVKHSDLIGSTISAVIPRVDDLHQSSVLTENGYIAPAFNSRDRLEVQDPPSASS